MNFFQNIYNSFYNINYQYYFFHIFVLYNNIVILKQDLCKSLYNISFIKMIVDIGNVIYKKNYNNMFKIRVESNTNSWINISIIEKQEYDYFSFIDKLVFFDNMIPLSLFTYKYLKPVIKHYKTYNYEENYFCENKEKTELYKKYTYFNSFFRQNSCYDILLIMKYDNIYKIKHVPSKDKNTDIIEKTLDISLIPSNVSFITIEYSHSENSKYSISLELPKSMFIVGNEILSACFVMRYLEHTVGAGVFDMNYTLNIMDNNINQFKMRNNQYCLLEKDSYKIIDI